MYPVVVRPAPHPAGIVIPATFPQGKATLRRAAHFYAVQPYTPSVVTYVTTAPPTQGSQRLAVSAYGTFYPSWVFPWDSAPNSGRGRFVSFTVNSL